MTSTELQAKIQDRQTYYDIMREQVGEWEWESHWKHVMNVEMASLEKRLEKIQPKKVK